MIRKLRLENFRRHVDTVLDFGDDDAQIVAITGPNGAGKTTILEALTYALYGEGRGGRRNLARLVRRGAEHEGMEVELEFHVGGVEYTLKRRLEKGKASATLMANGDLHMQSPDGVTAEVTKILGMDSTGFRLAVIAQQFDVAGLADLKPAVRQRTITRLLRQDALTRARNTATDEKNRQLDVLRAMGHGPDMDALSAAVEAADQEVADARQAVADSEAAVAALDGRLAASSSTRARWQDAQVALARAETTIAMLVGQEADLVAALARVHIPDVPAAPQVSLAKLTAELSEVNIAIATAEAGRELARTVEATRTELAAAEERLTAVRTRLGQATPASVAMDLSIVRGRVDTAQAEHAEAEQTVAALVAARVEPAGELAALIARAARAAKLGEVCDVCEQPITAEHRVRQDSERAARRAELTQLLADLDEQTSTARARLTTVAGELNDARADVVRLTARMGEVKTAVGDRDDLERRCTTYRERLERIKVPPADPGDLYARKGKLEVGRAAAEAYEQLLLAHQSATERAASLTESLTGVQAKLEAARLERDAAAPDAELAADHAALVELELTREQEQAMLAAVRIEVATLTERAQSARRALADGQVATDRLAQLRSGADLAAKTARVLEVTAELLATSIRPALEGAISEALTRLSEGRFTTVQVSESYEIFVLDDGAFQPMSELSGGEQVLVALATRLALAQVVAGRHQAGGIGLLVLDEVFGSQDADRREAILSALRALRALYGQILLISHVGGLDEVADKVIDVSLRAGEDGSTQAEAVAA